MRRLALFIAAAAVVISYGASIAWEIPRGDIIFSHERHVGERSIGCTFCHESVEKSTASSDKNLPTMDRCFVCHNDKTAPMDCSLCHRSPDAPSPLQNPKREINFSHMNHVKVRKLLCENCHRGVASATEMTQAQFPGMQVCMECHYGKKKTEECLLCHTDTEMVKKNRHPEGWVHRHKFMATEQPEECTHCHLTNATCQECHFGDNLQQRTHKLNFEFEHSLDARGKERDCTACHDEASFCAPCHHEREVMPEDHSRSFWISSGHGEAAIRDIEACAACHEEDELLCLKCHEERSGSWETIDQKPGLNKDRMKR
jgi:hypothetical protein